MIKITKRMLYVPCFPVERYPVSADLERADTFNFRRPRNGSGTALVTITANAFSFRLGAHNSRALSAPYRTWIGGWSDRRSLQPALTDDPLRYRTGPGTRHSGRAGSAPPYASALAAGWCCAGAGHRAARLSGRIQRVA